MLNSAKHRLTAFFLFCYASTAAVAEIAQIEIKDRHKIEAEGASIAYESVSGTLHYTLDPKDAANRLIVDIEHAPLNSSGLVSFTSNFKLLIPMGESASDTLVYYVNNRGRATLPPERDLSNPISQ
ncbi:MAG: hypothetical protein R3332_05500 [Pseudohongiellaceae bacterium]|nr:hypothetical protein [Pseudohongiellaceae bacterium]